MGTLRTKETEERYKKLKNEDSFLVGCSLCKAPSIIEFNHWRIIDNAFPYDYIADLHHMVVTKRHMAEDQLSQEEKGELESLRLGYINEKYEFLMEATKKKKSIPGHAHVHLIVAKERT